MRAKTNKHINNWEQLLRTRDYVGKCSGYYKGIVLCYYSEEIISILEDNKNVAM